MGGFVAGRTTSEMPGLDIAEQKSWQSFLDSALRLSATLNRRLTDAHQLSLFDVRVLDMLDHAPTGCARMGDLAEALPSLPSLQIAAMGENCRRISAALKLSERVSKAGAT